MRINTVVSDLSAAAQFARGSTLAAAPGADSRRMEHIRRKMTVNEAKVLLGGHNPNAKAPTAQSSGKRWVSRVEKLKRDLKKERVLNAKRTVLEALRPLVKDLEAECEALV